MGQPSEKSKATIDRLTKAELLTEKEKGRTSQFQGANFDYLKERLAHLEEEEREAGSAAEATYREETLDAAEDANAIARHSNKLSKIAIGISVAALIVAALSFLCDAYCK